MPLDRRQLLGTAIGLAAAGAAEARTPLVEASDAPDWPPREHFPLWPASPPGAPAPLPRFAPTMHGAPGHRALQLRGIAAPELGVYPAERPDDGRALIVIPGGGYEFLSIQNGGINIARAFNARGITAFVLTYRLPGEGWSARADVPLQDAQRAIRLVRANAARWRIDPAKLGIVGFSAGGHVAATLATSFDERVYRAVDAADAGSARPAFAGLIYPVITMGPETHAGSRDRLLGPSPDAAAIAHRSAEKRLTAATPPLFLVHATDDRIVPLDNSLMMLAAARAAKVPVGAHILERGGHGFGVHLPPTNPGSRWPELFDLYMRGHVAAG